MHRTHFDILQTQAKTLDSTASIPTDSAAFDKRLTAGRRRRRTPERRIFPVELRSVVRLTHSMLRSRFCVDRVDAVSSVCADVAPGQSCSRPTITRQIAYVSHLSAIPVYWQPESEADGRSEGRQGRQSTPSEPPAVVRCQRRRPHRRADRCPGRTDASTVERSSLHRLQRRAATSRPVSSQNRISHFPTSCTFGRFW